MAKRKTSRQEVNRPEMIDLLLENLSGVGKLRVGSDLGGDLFLGDSVDNDDDDNDDDDLINDFIHEVESILEMIPRSVAKRAKQTASTSITVQWIDNNLRIAGTCDEGGQTYRIFASGQYGDEPAGCTCELSQLEFPCVHVVHFIEYVTTNMRRALALQDRDKNTRPSKKPRPRQPPSAPTQVADIVNRIRKREFDSVEKVGRFLVPDQAEQWLKGLASHWQPEKMRPVSNDSLPRIEDPSVTQGRIAWDFEVLAASSNTSDRVLTIEALLQTPRKRGDGFTKGKRISTERLRRGQELPLDDTDRKIISLYKTDLDHWDYQHRLSSRRNEISATEALKHLIGCDRVTLFGEAATVTPAGLRIGLIEADDSLHLRYVQDDGTSHEVVIFPGEEALVHIDKIHNRIGVSLMSNDLVTLHHDLLTAPSFPANKKKEIAKTLRPLQKSLSLMLPISTDGEAVATAAPLVVLLRSRSDGALDYGIRFRDAAGGLHLPAAGPQVQSVGTGQSKYQSVRIPEDELRRASDFVKRLGLNADAFGGWYDTINNLRDSLDLMSSLQTLASQSDDPENKIEFLWDRTSERPIQFAGNISRGNVKVEISKKRNWFTVGGSVTVGEQSVALPDLLANLTPAQDDAIAGDFVKLADGQWAKIEAKLRDRLVNLRTAAHDVRGGMYIDATAAGEIQQLADEEIEIRAADAWQKCAQRLTESRDFHPIVPENLDANLRDYQVDGFRWMSRLARWGVGGILADDMGLGKTLQTLAVLLQRGDDGPALVIAPTSVGFNWAREANRFAPDLIVHLYRETDRAEFLKTLQPNDVVICSYGLAMRDADPLAKVDWHTLVLDEAQAIKNSRSKTSIAIANLTADWTVALTGTPVENHLGELWSLFHVVSPGVFGGWSSFRDRFASPIEKDNDLDTRAALANRLKPFVLRRTKNEVLTELPARTEMNLYVDLSKEERKIYDTIRLDAISDIKAIAKDDDVKDARFKILAAMTRLRQIACHPVMVDEDYEGGSAKLDCLIETMRNLQSEGHRVLIFSQFVKHLALIRAALDENSVTYEYLDGATPAAKRQEAVDRFQSGNADAFLISLKAGGTGLNLTAADYVIHMDPWWNPAVEDQATDRAHRMGQTKPVMVYRIVSRGTIEQEILKMHDEKRDLAAGVIDGTAVAGKLSNEDLIEMLTHHDGA